MDIDKLIHDLRARINPQYYDQIGTESYERHQVVKALEYLATENKRLKELMAKRTREHQQEMTSFRLRVRSQDDATFAALREENERQRFDILAMNQSLDLLRQENERLRVQLAGCGVARSTDRNARLVNQCRDHDTRRAAAVAQCAAMAEEIQQLNETITALTRESRDAQEM